jgi:uncharacterized protein YegJ (DUF2314 family)
MGTESSDIPLFVDLNDNDPALVEAVKEARRTVPMFLDAISKMCDSTANPVIKVPFIDRSDAGKQALVRTPESVAENPGRPGCHLWLRVTSVLDDLIFCSVGQAPDALQLKRGTSFVIASESIEDWMINHDGVVFGGFSLRVIRSRLRKEEQIRFDVHTGILQFREITP